MNWRFEHNLPDLRRALQRAPVECMRGLDRGMGRGALHIMRLARSKAPKATSLLTQTILAGRIGLGEHIITALAGYAGPVEQGRDPGGPMPPLQPIIDWIRARRIEPKGAGIKTERDLAWVIARKIQRDGSPAQPFMQPALAEGLPLAARMATDGAMAGARRAFA